MDLPSYILEELKLPYELSQAQLDFYNENRFIKLKGVFSSRVIDHFEPLITRVVNDSSLAIDPMDERDTYGKAFLQVFNLWRSDPLIRSLVMSPRLAGIASALMEVGGVRIYHDQALYKEGGGGITPWHADQFYWPLASDKCITAWIPLQAVPLEMGPLEFSAQSHRIVEGRELAISETSEQFIGQRLKISDLSHIVEPFELGEISFHSGWLFHRAGANTTGLTRKVMTAIYMDHEMKLKEPENSNQELDRDTWCPGAVAGEVIDTELNPRII